MEMGARISSPCKKSLNNVRGNWRTGMCSSLESEITHSRRPGILQHRLLRLSHPQSTLVTPNRTKQLPANSPQTPFTDKIRRLPTTNRKINYGNFDNVESFHSFTVA